MSATMVSCDLLLFCRCAIGALLVRCCRILSPPLLLYCCEISCILAIYLPYCCYIAAILAIYCCYVISMFAIYLQYCCYDVSIFAAVRLPMACLFQKSFLELISVFRFRLRHRRVRPQPMRTGSLPQHLRWFHLRLRQRLRGRKQRRLRR